MTATPTTVTIPADVEERLLKAVRAITDAQATPFHADPDAWWNRMARAYHEMADGFEAAMDHTQPHSLVRHALINAARAARENAEDAERHADRAKTAAGGAS